MGVSLLVVFVVMLLSLVAVVVEMDVSIGGGNVVWGDMEGDEEMKMIQ